MPFKPKSWAAFRQAVMARYRPWNRSDSTRRDVENALDRLEALGAESPADLTRELIGRLIASHPPGESPETLKKLLRQVHAVCTIAKELGDIEAIPFDDDVTNFMKPGPSKGSILTREETGRILRTARNDVSAAETLPPEAQWKARRLYALTATLAYCGLRASEALHLHVGDVEVEGCFLFIPPDDADGDPHFTPVAMPKAVAAVLADWLAHRMDSLPRRKAPAEECPWVFPGVKRRTPWTSGTPGGRCADAIRELGRRAGVEGLTPDMFRRSLRTHLEAHGMLKFFLDVALRTPGKAAWVNRSERLALTYARHIREAVADLDFEREAS